MKSFILSLIWLSTIQASAGVVENYKVSDPTAGSFRIHVADLGEPAIAPYIVNIKVECKDSAGQAKSAAKEVLPTERLCQYTGHSYDSKTKTLTVRAISLELWEKDEAGNYLLDNKGEKIPLTELKCGKPWIEEFKFSEVCAAGAR